MIWYGIERRGGVEHQKYRCEICVAAAKIKIDRECERFRRYGRNRNNAAAQ